MAAFEREADPTLRDRLKRGDDGQHEAVLAWVVQGAIAWYRIGRVLPPAPSNVIKDTRSWREDSDAILGFIADNLVYDDETHVMTTEFLAAFNGWLKARGHREWSDQTLSGRLKEHDGWQRVEYRQVLSSEPGLSRPPWAAIAVPKRYRAWLGVRFRTASDDDEGGNDDVAKSHVAQGAQRCPEIQILRLHEEPSDCPVHPVQSNGSYLAGKAPNGAPIDNSTVGRDESAEQRPCDGCGISLERGESIAHGRCLECRTAAGSERAAL